MDYGSTETSTDYEFILFDWLLTPQDFVRRERVEFFKSLYKSGAICSPVEVMIYDDVDYLLIDCNHRARVAWENGDCGITAKVVYHQCRMLGRPKKIKDLMVEDCSARPEERHRTYYMVKFIG